MLFLGKSISIFLSNRKNHEDHAIFSILRKKHEDHLHAIFCIFVFLYFFIYFRLRLRVQRTHPSAISAAASDAAAAT